MDDLLADGYPVSQVWTTRAPKCRLASSPPRLAPTSRHIPPDPAPSHPDPTSLDLTSIPPDLTPIPPHQHHPIPLRHHGWLRFAAQLIQQMFDFMLKPEAQFNSGQLSKVSIQLAEMDKQLIDGADDYVQMMNLLAFCVRQF